MKKILFALVLCAFFTINSLAQIKFGVTAGVNYSDNIWKLEDGSSSNNGRKTGFRVGVISDMSINDKVSIMPELLFTQLGNIGSPTVRLTLNYLQLPVNVVYKLSVGNNSKLLVMAGPYLGYGLSAKLTAPNAPKVKFGSGEDEYKPLDYGLNIGFGYEYRNLFVKFQFHPGLSNMVNVAKENWLGDTTTGFKNINTSISVGYYFHNKLR